MHHSTKPTSQRRKTASLLIIINILLAMALGGMIYVKIADKSGTDSRENTSSNHNKTPSQETNTSRGVSQTQSQVTSRNIERENDASRVLSAAQEYIANNTGGLPTSFEDGNFHGESGDYPSLIDLEYYTTVGVSASEQGAATTDVVTLVTGAICTEEGSAKSAATSSRSIAVLYAQETSVGTFMSHCMNG
ncbi:MAG TPA: hypothetical protein VLA92_01020 [Candidatus Saccharimonadales bacterium]|nr:hypothetical protein [Candidatus Saccharimonadales bacterium]